MKEIEVEALSQELARTIEAVGRGDSFVITRGGVPIARLLPNGPRARTSDVFVSYSRRDIAYARVLCDALVVAGLDTWIDWARIPVGEDWWQEICDAILTAHTVLFLLSEASLSSNVCSDEIAWASQHCKRIIPVLLDGLEVGAVKKSFPDLVRTNWLVASREACFVASGSDVMPKLPEFQDAMARLNQAIHTDWEWVKIHTSLLEQTVEWQRDSEHPDHLLRGKALRDLCLAIDAPIHRDPELTADQSRFVKVCRDAEENRLSATSAWYSIPKSEYRAIDLDLECLRCGYSHEFTPSIDRSPPSECPGCGYRGGWPGRTPSPTPLT